MLKIEEQRTIEAMTWSELQAAFSGLRLELSDNRQARYTVRVVQQFPPSRGIGAAGESRVLRPRGGAGAVNFLMLGSQAVSHAPRGADRRTVVEGIGRGIGRGAVHEFTHQLVPHVAIHDSQDPTSYEFAFSSRTRAVLWRDALEHRVGRASGQTRSGRSDPGDGPSSLSE